MPPVSTSQNDAPAQSVSAKWRSRVVPASSQTIALVVADDAVEQRRLADVRPADERDDGNRSARRDSGEARLAFVRQHVDEVVRRIHRHRAAARAAR